VNDRREFGTLRSADMVKKKATKAQGSKAAKGGKAKSSPPKRHRLSVIPIREAIDTWLRQAGVHRDGDPDISNAFKQISELKKRVPNCFSEEGERCNEVPCPPPPPVNR
jgi:hypothetical protein